MLKKLYGLFIYRLQATSFFSIMERLSGFILLFALYYFFVAEFIFNTTSSSIGSYLVYVLENFSLFIVLLVFFFFIFHIINGLRIYLMSFYFYINLKKKPMLLENFYSFILLEKRSIIKVLLLKVKQVFNFLKTFTIKSNLSFIFIIFCFYFFFILFFLI